MVATISLNGRALVVLTFAPRRDEELGHGAPRLGVRGLEKVQGASGELEPLLARPDVSVALAGDLERLAVLDGGIQPLPARPEQVEADQRGDTAEAHGNSLLDGDAGSWIVEVELLLW